MTDAPFFPHMNEDILPRHAYYVPGIIDEQGYAYVYMMTAGQPTVDSFIRDISRTIRIRTPEQFEEMKATYPCLNGMKLFKVGVLQVLG